jgi:hypothetical protein
MGQQQITPIKRTLQVTYNIGCDNDGSKRVWNTLLDLPLSSFLCILLEKEAIVSGGNLQRKQLDNFVQQSIHHTLIKAPTFLEPLRSSNRMSPILP